MEKIINYTCTTSFKSLLKIVILQKNALYFLAKTSASNFRSLRNERSLLCLEIFTITKEEKDWSYYFHNKEKSSEINKLNNNFTLKGEEVLNEINSVLEK